jgi:DNA-binding response OmpR family regulator
MNATLLLVDADPHLRQRLADFLSAQGYSCRYASDGEDALREIERSVPDLVILDRALRRMSGDELARRLQGDPRFAQVPLIILSACDPSENAMIGFEVPADDYFRKPFSAALLVQRIRMRLGSLAVA